MKHPYTNILRPIFFLFLFLFLPRLVFASVKISEIMYDPPGPDASHEWIEIENSGTESVDISGWKFFENNANHALALIAGGSVLPAGGFAVIAENAATFQSDYPQFGGMLFDSVFSLSNGGETVALKDSSGAVMNEVTYTSTQGATGDGNSLNGGLSSWVAGLATPGAPMQASQSAQTGESNQNSENDTGQSPADQGSAASESSGEASVKPKPEKKTEKKIVVNILPPAGALLSDATVLFSVKVTDVTGQETRRGRIFWNYGEGESEMAQNTDPVRHVFTYPGRYVVQASYFENFYDSEPKASDRITASVSAPSVEFTDDGLTLFLKNTGKAEMDISLWDIEAEKTNVEKSDFSFQKSTILLAGSFIILEKKKSGLGDAAVYFLKYPNGRLIATTEVSLDLSDAVFPHEGTASSGKKSSRDPDSKPAKKILSKESLAKESLAKKDVTKESITEENSETTVGKVLGEQAGTETGGGKGAGLGQAGSAGILGEIAMGSPEDFVASATAADSSFSQMIGDAQSVQKSAQNNILNEEDSKKEDQQEENSGISRTIFLLAIVVAISACSGILLSHLHKKQKETSEGPVAD